LVAALIPAPLRSRQDTGLDDVAGVSQGAKVDHLGGILDAGTAAVGEHPIGDWAEQLAFL
jgi:hypothetical protein